MRRVTWRRATGCDSHMGTWVESRSLVHNGRRGDVTVHMADVHWPRRGGIRMSDEASAPAAEHPRRRAPRRTSRTRRSRACSTITRASGPRRASACSQVMAAAAVPAQPRSARTGDEPVADDRHPGGVAAPMYGPASSIAAIEAAARARGYWVSTANIDASDPQSIPAGLAHLMAQSDRGPRRHRPAGAGVPRAGRAAHRHPLRHPAVHRTSTPTTPSPSTRSRARASRQNT